MSEHNQHVNETREAVDALRLLVLSELEAELAVTEELLHQSRARVAVLEQAIEAAQVAMTAAPLWHEQHRAAWDALKKLEAMK